MKPRIFIAIICAIVATTAGAQNSAGRVQSDMRDASAAFIATQHFIVGRIGRDCLAEIGRTESPQEYQQKWEEENAAYFAAATKYMAARLEEIEDPAERENVEASYNKSVEGTGEAAAARLLSNGPKNDACKYALTIVDTGSMNIEEYAKIAKLPIMKHLTELVDWAKAN